MRIVLAILIFLAAIGGGIYVGGYLMFYMGIVHIVAGFAATPANAGLVAWGFVQVLLLWETLGGLTFWVIAAIAAAVGGIKPPHKQIADRRRRRRQAA